MRYTLTTILGRLCVCADVIMLSSVCREIESMSPVVVEMRDKFTTLFKVAKYCMKLLLRFRFSVTLQLTLIYIKSTYIRYTLCACIRRGLSTAQQSKIFFTVIITYIDS